MTQEELNNAILEIQVKLSYHVCDDILEPASYGNFNEDEHIIAFLQMLKALWRYNVDPEETNSCLTENDVCRIIDYLNEEIPFPKLAKKQNLETGFTYHDHVFEFNLKDCDDECKCVSDYQDVRIDLKQGDKIIAIYTIDTSLVSETPNISIRPLTVIGDCTIGFCLKDTDIIEEGLLLMDIKVDDGCGLTTILKDHKLKILKNV